MAGDGGVDNVGRTGVTLGTRVGMNLGITGLIGCPFRSIATLTSDDVIHRVWRKLGN
jgi:hypothetical protein